MLQKCLTILSVEEACEKCGSTRKLADKVGKPNQHYKTWLGKRLVVEDERGRMALVEKTDFWVSK